MLIRYYGHVGLPTGYGDAANEICMAILSAGLDLEISTDGKELGPAHLPLANHLRDECDLSAPDVVIIHTLPIDCARLLAKTQIRERFPKAMCVAYTTWEGASDDGIPPVISQSLQAFDHVWVPSMETSAAVERGVPRTLKPAEVVPHAFDEARQPDLVAPASSDGGYRFYYVGAWTRRKNVEGVIRAYLRAFTKDDHATLLIQSAGAQPSACQLAALSTGIDPREWPPMHFSHERVSGEEIVQIHRAGDCFVTASRGEAWNIPAFDAMLAGNHVIAPKGQGSDDFLLASSADRYGSRLEPAFGDVRLVNDERAGPGHARAQLLTSQGLTCRASWRDPDIAELSRVMRAAYDQQRSSLRVYYDPVARFGRRAVGRIIKDLLEGTLP